MKSPFLKFTTAFGFCAITSIVWGLQWIVAYAVEEMVPSKTLTCSYTGPVQESGSSGVVAEFQCGNDKVGVTAKQSIKVFDSQLKVAQCSRLEGVNSGEVKWECDI